MSSSGIILTLAYPDTIVMVSEEWFSPFLKFIGIGKKNYVKAGHAALVLIHKKTGDLECHEPNFISTLKPKPIEKLHEKALWLSGIAAGAWFKLYHNGHQMDYQFRRISPHGNIDLTE